MSPRRRAGRRFRRLKGVTVPVADLVALVVVEAPTGGRRRPPVRWAGVQAPADHRERSMRWLWSTTHREIVQQCMVEGTQRVLDTFTAEIERQFEAQETAYVEACRHAVERAIFAKDQQIEALRKGPKEAAAKKRRQAATRNSRHNAAIDKLHRRGWKGHAIYTELQRRARESAEEPGAKAGAAANHPSRRWVDARVKKLDRSGS